MIRKNRRRRWLRLLIILAGLVLAGLLFWQLPVFRLGRIEADAMRSASEAEILAASGLMAGQHLASGLGGSWRQVTQLRYPAVESQLQAAFPTIRTVTARLVFPGCIRLEIEERVEVAYVGIPDGCVMIDKEGVALSILGKAPPGIPVIGGVTVTAMQLGQPLGVDVPSAMNSAIGLMGAIIEADKDERPPIQLLPQISMIRPVGGRLLYLTVILPETGEELSVAAETGQEQTEDMLWLRFALSQGVFGNRGKGVLDLTGNRRTFTPD